MSHLLHLCDNTHTLHAPDNITLMIIPGRRKHSITIYIASHKPQPHICISIYANWSGCLHDV